MSKDLENRLKDEGKISNEYDLTKEMRRMPLSAVVGVFNQNHVILIFHYLRYLPYVPTVPYEVLRT